MEAASVETRVDQSNPSQRLPAADEAAAPQVLAKHRPRPLPPPMQTVTKGWWVLREGQTTAEELAKARHGDQ